MTVDAKTAAWAAKQPKKLVAAKVVVKSTAGNILLVKPTYKPTWQFPGGGVDAGESPEAAAVRELHEELGLRIATADLKLVGLVYRKDLDNLFPMYELQVLLKETDKLTVQADELEGYKYVAPSEVASRISGYYSDFWHEYVGSLVA